MESRNFVIESINVDGEIWFIVRDPKNGRPMCVTGNKDVLFDCVSKIG